MKRDAWEASDTANVGSLAWEFMLAAALGGVLPFLALCGGACLSLGLWARPAQLGLIALAGLLVGARIARRPGPAGAVALKLGLLVSSMQTAPILGSAGLVALVVRNPGLLGAPADSPNILFIQSTVLILLAFAAMNLAVTFLIASASSLAGHSAARAGAFGPAFRGPETDSPARSKVELILAYGLSVAVLVATTSGAVNLASQTLIDQALAEMPSE